MTKNELLYEGKAKRLFTTDDPNLLLAEFKDDLTAFNGEKHDTERGKGALNNKISTELFKLLENAGIPTHYVDTPDDNHMLVKKVDIILIEVVVRNIATGSLTKRLDIPDGTELPFALVEFYYKRDDLGDPLINDEHCIILDLVKNEADLEELKRLGREINTILKAFFAKKGLNLVDFKVEFGYDAEGRILLADEISPDSCRFWDMASGEKLDKDLFRQGLGGLKVAYEEVLKRILGENR
ncbi:phosphoribosylaminoimidazolesuccinocarboxamide synthase [Hydrogenimonas sp.]